MSRNVISFRQPSTEIFFHVLLSARGLKRGRVSQTKPCSPHCQEIKSRLCVSYRVVSLVAILRVFSNNVTYFRFANFFSHIPARKIQKGMGRIRARPTLFIFSLCFAFLTNTCRMHNVTCNKIGSWTAPIWNDKTKSNIIITMLLYSSRLVTQ